MTRGTILAWEPPHRLTMTWRIGPGWRSVTDDERASCITVEFTPAGDEASEDTFIHSELDRHGEMAGQVRAALAGDGPGESLRRYADVVARHAAGLSRAAEPATARADPNQQVVGEFRVRGGTVDGMHAGMPLLLLTTVGARSGRRHTVPLTYLADEGSYVVAGGAAGPAGPDSNPAWYHNLRARPAVTIEVGTEVLEAVARVTAGAERDRLFDRYAAEHPQLLFYQARTSRQVPVIVLVPVRPGPGHDRSAPRLPEAKW